MQSLCRAWLAPLTLAVTGTPLAAADDTSGRLEPDARIEVFRLGANRPFIARNRLTATFTRNLSRTLELQLLARRYDDVVTVESADTDEWQGAAQPTFEPARAHRFRLQGSWRGREYDNDDDPATTGQGPRLDAQFRRRLAANHYLAFDLRAEHIRAGDPDRGYERESAQVSYTRPISPDLRVRPALEWIQTRFDGRRTEAGALRRDRQVVPEVELLWWPGRWRIEGEAKYIFVNSNERAREREGHRLTVSFGYAD